MDNGVPICSGGGEASARDEVPRHASADRSARPDIIDRSTPGQPPRALNYDTAAVVA